MSIYLDDDVKKYLETLTKLIVSHNLDELVSIRNYDLSQPCVEFEFASLT